MTTIDTPAMIAALGKTWLKTKTVKNAAVFIDKLQSELDKVNAEVLAVANDPDKRTSIELKVALATLTAERDAALAKVEEYKARTRQAEKAHDASGAMVRELQAERDGANKVDPPLPVPLPEPITQPVPAELVNKLIVAAVSNETNRCAKIASIGYAGGVNVDVWNRLTKTQNYQYLCLFIEYAIRSQTPPPITIVK